MFSWHARSTLSDQLRKSICSLETALSVLWDRWNKILLKGYINMISEFHEAKIPAVKFHQQKRSSFAQAATAGLIVLSLSNMVTVSWKGLFGFLLTAMPLIQCSDVCQGIIYITEGGGHIIELKKSRTSVTASNPILTFHQLNRVHWGQFFINGETCLALQASNWASKLRFSTPGKTFWQFYLKQPFSYLYFVSNGCMRTVKTRQFMSFNLISPPWAPEELGCRDQGPLSWDPGVFKVSFFKTYMWSE